ncbi:MAG: hypothetical protein GY719_21360 [bacterium]|nr:hypothetical protein [bacterium]
MSKLLKRWFGLRPKAIISEDKPDRMGIDRRLTVVSPDDPSHNVFINWQAKARTLSPRYSRVFKEPAYVVYLSSSEARSLMAGRSQGDPLILALAIPRIPVTIDLMMTSPEQQFDWFAIDLDQYLRRIGISHPDELKSIHVPIRNRLNLASASLLWGSLWFSRQVSALSHTIFEADPFLRKLTETFLWDSGNSKALRDLDLGQLARRYRRSLEGIDPIDRPLLNFLYGTALAQAGISSTVARHGRIDSYLVYAVEALGEGVNLWLFSRQVRRFLYFTRSACEGEYLRLFPVRGADLLALPEVVRCALSHVYRVHILKGVELGFVKPFVEREATDHVHIGGLGGVRTFVIDQGDSWKLSFDKRMTIEKELLGGLARETILERKILASQLLFELGLSEEDVRLGFSPPVCLLAPESRTLEHPHELWLTGAI